MMIGENIQRARRAKGVSQEELAVRLHVVRQTVSKWEKGASVPDADMVVRLAEALEVPVSRLLGTSPQEERGDLADILARLNGELAEERQARELLLQAGKKRGMILLLCFAAALVMLTVKNEPAAILLTGACVLTALIVLYRNLALLTRVTTADLRLGPARAVTIFDIAVIALAAAVAALERGNVIHMTDRDGRLFAMALTAALFLFGGFISPRLPFSRHTGLRLPWTVADEDTWNVAHRVLGVIALPLTLVYIGAACAAGEESFKAVSMAAILLYIAIPGLLSLAFWGKKFHGKGR